MVGAVTCETVLTTGAVTCATVLVTGTVTCEMVVVTGAVTCETVVVTGAVTCETVLVTGATTCEEVVVTGAVTVWRVLVAGAVTVDMVVVRGTAARETVVVTGAAGAAICDTALLAGWVIGATTAGTGALTATGPDAADATPEVTPAAAADRDPTANTAMMPSAPATATRRSHGIATPECPSSSTQGERLAPGLARASSCITTTKRVILPYLKCIRWSTQYGPETWRWKHLGTLVPRETRSFGMGTRHSPPMVQVTRSVEIQSRHHSKVPTHLRNQTEISTTADYRSVIASGRVSFRMVSRDASCASSRGNEVLVSCRTI